MDSHIKCRKRSTVSFFREKGYARKATMGSIKLQFLV